MTSTPTLDFDMAARGRYDSRMTERRLSLSFVDSRSGVVVAYIRDLPGAVEEDLWQVVGRRALDDFGGALQNWRHRSATLKWLGDGCACLELGGRWYPAPLRKARLFAHIRNTVAHVLEKWRRKRGFGAQHAPSAPIQLTAQERARLEAAVADLQATGDLPAQLPAFAEEREKAQGEFSAHGFGCRPRTRRSGRRGPAPRYVVRLPDGETVPHDRFAITAGEVVSDNDYRGAARSAPGPPVLVARPAKAGSHIQLNDR